LLALAVITLRVATNVERFIPVGWRGDGTVQRQS
jgi:hypothetical protein